MQRVRNKFLYGLTNMRLYVIFRGHVVLKFMYDYDNYKIHIMPASLMLYIDNPNGRGKCRIYDQCLYRDVVKRVRYIEDITDKCIEIFRFLHFPFPISNQTTNE